MAVRIHRTPAESWIVEIPGVLAESQDLHLRARHPSAAGSRRPRASSRSDESAWYTGRDRVDNRAFRSCPFRFPGKQARPHHRDQGRSETGPRYGRTHGDQSLGLHTRVAHVHRCAYGRPQEPTRLDPELHLGFLDGRAGGGPGPDSIEQFLHVVAVEAQTHAGAGRVRAWRGSLRIHGVRAALDLWMKTEDLTF